MRKVVPGFLHFYALGTLAGTTVDAWKVKAPYKGRVLEYGGYIEGINGGVGYAADLQIRNVSTGKGLFDGWPWFEEGLSPEDWTLQNSDPMLDELIRPAFDKGDILSMDIYSYGTCHDAVVWLYCQFDEEEED